MKIRKILLTFVFLLISIFSFSEVPHSYVIENPEKAITVTETLKKYKDKAELNLSITKAKSKEIIAVETDYLVIVDLEDAKEIKEDNIVITQDIQAKEDEVNFKIEDNVLVISEYEEDKDIYINVLDDDRNVITIYKVLRNKIQTFEYSTPSNMYYEITNEYEGGEFVFRKDMKSPQDFQPKGIIVLTPDSGRYEYFFFKGSCESQFFLNGKLLKRAYCTIQHGNEGNLQFERQTVNISDELIVEIVTDFPGTSHCFWECYIKFLKFPKTEFTLTFTKEGRITDGKSSLARTNHFHFKYKVLTLKGNSILTINEYYPVNETIKFSGTTMEDRNPLTLENSVRDVSLTTTGDGIVTLLEKDTLELNGKKYTINTGGNLPEQTDTIGNIKFKFKVEAGKLRLSLTEWGILEPDRNIPINVYRVEEGQENKIVEHTLTIKAPRRVEGNSTLKFDANYYIRDIVKLQGISLTAPAILNLETPIPAGVSLKQIDGYGVPFLKEGDILEVGNNITRTVKQYTIAKGDSLKKSFIDLSGTNLTLYVENGKVRIGLNDWLANKNTSLQLRVIRGTNEICNLELGLEVPEAPYNVVKKGVLDFGTVLAGSKNKYAEADIVLDMLQEVGEVKYSLSTSNPEMENSNGTKLVAKEVKAVVLKQSGDRYLVKVQGYLDVPAKQELGEYRGSMLLNIETQ